MFKWGCAIAGLMVGAMPVMALAQEQAPAEPQVQDGQVPLSDDQDMEDVPEIVVSGELRGAVAGDIPPEVQLTPADIRAYGVSSISELITELAAQTGSARGREGGQPVLLLNGRRISGRRELEDVPTEAIERVDILPEEVSLKYGYRADQRVINIVLRERFRSVVGEIEGRMPTAGGFAAGEVDVDIIRINRDGRLNISVEGNASSGLLESERDIIPTGSDGLFDPRGNIAGIGGGEIDPALSALAGQPVTTAGIPALAAGGAPTLASFGALANQPYAPDSTPYRTLISPSRQFKVNGVYSRNLSSKIGGTVTASVEGSNSRSRNGLGNVSLLVPDSNGFSPFANDVQLYRAFDELGALEGTSKSLTAQAGFTLNGDGLPWSDAWRWSLTGNYNRTTRRTTTDRGVDAASLQALLDADDPAFNPFAPVAPSLIQLRPQDSSRSTSSVGSVNGLINGPLFKLPAGDASTSIRFTGQIRDFDSESLRNGVPRASDISRDTGGVLANLDLPIASRRRGVLDAIGDFSLNANVEVEQLSDFGTLVTTGYGANWSPIRQVRLIASFTNEEGAPSETQLGDPSIANPNVRVYDFVRGETATITSISGGNPNLLADSRDVMKLGINIRPLEDTNLDFRADYVSSTTRDLISSRFPSATAEVEAAFPDRFVRDPGGRLLSIDNRPVNLASAEREELRWGFNLSLPLSSSREKLMRERRAQREAQRAAALAAGTPLPPEGPRRAPGDAPPGEGAAPGAGEGPRREGGFGRGPGGGGGRSFGGGGGGRGGLGGPNGAGAGRLFFNAYHTWVFRDQIRIRDGLPTLDQLNGTAVTSSNGVAAHQVSSQLGVSKDGLRVNLQGNWRSGTQVTTGTFGSGDELNFGSLATLNLRVRADLAEMFTSSRPPRWMRGASVNFAIDNIFDGVQRITDEAGVVPLNYQPGLVDIASRRTVRLSFRKLFR